MSSRLDIVERAKGGKSKRAFEALEALHDACVSPLGRELRANYPPRAYAAALVLGSIAERGSMEAKLALLDYVRDPQNAGVVGVALDGLKDERDETLHGLTDAVLAFLESPACLLECPRDPAVFDERPARMTGRRILDEFRAVDLEDRTSQLLPAFRIIENGEEPRAIPFLARALSWRDPTLVAHEESLRARGLIEFGALQARADEHVRVAAAKALGETLDAAAFAPLAAALEDEDADVRIAAADSLTTIGVICDDMAPGVLAALKQLVLAPDPVFPEDVDDPNDSFADSHAEIRASVCCDIASLSYVDDRALMDELMASDNELIRCAAYAGYERWRQQVLELQNPVMADDVTGSG